MGIDPRQGLQPGRIVLMVRRRVEGLGYAEFRERAVADFSSHHECRDARDVGLKRERHQVEHQVRVFLIVLGNPAGSRGHGKV